MDFSKMQVPFNKPRPDRKAKVWPRCWKDWPGRKKPRQYNVVTINA